MNELTDERNADDASLDLEAIKARAAAATEGPWEWDDPTIGQHWSSPEPWATVVDDEVNCGGYCYGGSSSPIKSDADGQFIAHAREDIPALVAEVERLREEREELQRRLDPPTVLALLDRLDAVLKLTRCGVDEGGKSYHGMRCDCWGPRDRP